MWRPPRPTRGAVKKAEGDGKAKAGGARNLRGAGDGEEWGATGAGAALRSRAGGPYRAIRRR